MGRFSSLDNRILRHPRPLGSADVQRYTPRCRAVAHRVRCSALLQALPGQGDDPGFRPKQSPVRDSGYKEPSWVSSSQPQSFLRLSGWTRRVGTVIPTCQHQPTRALSQRTWLQKVRLGPPPKGACQMLIKVHKTRPHYNPRRPGRRTTNSTWSCSLHASLSSVFFPPLPIGSLEGPRA